MKKTTKSLTTTTATMSETSALSSSPSSGTFATLRFDRPSGPSRNSGPSGLARPNKREQDRKSSSSTKIKNRHCNNLPNPVRGTPWINKILFPNPGHKDVNELDKQFMHILNTRIYLDKQKTQLAPIQIEYFCFDDPRFLNYNSSANSKTSSASASAKTIVFCHGNADSAQLFLRHMYKELATITAPPLTGIKRILCVEYPGYGNSTLLNKNNNNTTDVNGVVANNMSVKQQSVKKTMASEHGFKIWYPQMIERVLEHYKLQWSDIYLVGFSIGTGPSTWIAAHYPIKQLTLVAPFTSIRDVAIFHSPFLGHFVVDRFNSLQVFKQGRQGRQGRQGQATCKDLKGLKDQEDRKDLKDLKDLTDLTDLTNPADQTDLSTTTNSNVSKQTKINCPILLMHGDQDKTIPVQHSQLLFKAARDRGLVCDLVIMKGIAHVDVSIYTVLGRVSKL